MEEYEAWSASTKRHEAVAKAADENGGPRLSLIPAIEQNEAWPTDLLHPAAEPDTDGGTPAKAGVQPEEKKGTPACAGAQASEQPVAAMPFDGVPLEDSRKHLAGWSAERQRVFLTHLAETGSVHLASGAARLSARGAYRLRTRSPAFARGWDLAVQLSVGRLTAIALDRAIHGRVEQVYHQGVLVGEKRVPSDRLLTWLLARLDPRRFALPWEQRGDADPQAEAAASFDGALDALTDSAA